MSTTLAQPLDSTLDLTDDQVDFLLARASRRLAEKAAAGEKALDRPLLTIPKLDASGVQKPQLITHGKVAKIRTSKDEPEQSSGIRKVEDPVVLKQRAAEEKKATAGAQWYNLPKTKVTPELKRDLQLLKMRNVLDPHRHYKKDNSKMAIPEFSQVGTIVEGPTEFFSGRIENRDRKRTFVEEVLAGEQETGRFKRKYGEVQAKKSSGKKAYYKALQAKRKTGVKKGG